MQVEAIWGAFGRQGRPKRLAAGCRASRSLTASSRRDGPVVAAVVLPAGDLDPAVCFQQGCDGFPLLPADLQRQRTAGAERSLVVFREGTVKYKAVLPRCQRHGRFLCHFGLQLPHLGSGQVGRV